MFVLGPLLHNTAAVSGPAASGTHWNTSSDTPASSTHWVISGAGNNIGTFNTSSVWGTMIASASKAVGDFTITIGTYTGTSQIHIGLATGTLADNAQPSGSATAVSILLFQGNIYNAGVFVGTFGSGYANGDMIKVANASGMVSFYHNGSLLTTVDATATGSSLYPIVTDGDSGQVISADFTNW